MEASWGRALLPSSGPGRPGFEGDTGILLPYCNASENVGTKVSSTTCESPAGLFQCFKTGLMAGRERCYPEATAWSEKPLQRSAAISRAHNSAAQPPKPHN